MVGFKSCEKLFDMYLVACIGESIFVCELWQMLHQIAYWYMKIFSLNLYYHISPNKSPLPNSSSPSWKNL